MELTPVDFDPFVNAPNQTDRAPVQVTVRPDAASRANLTPVDHDPFATDTRGAMDKLTGKGGERYQLWPERLARHVASSVWSGVTAPGDASQGKFSPAPETPGMLTEGDVFRQDMAGKQQLRRAFDTAFIGTPMAPRGANPIASPQIIEEAQRLMADAQGRGIALSWPEALTQVAGRPILSNTMRHLEAAPATSARMDQFYGARARNVENAGREAIDQIAPINPNPSTIGPAAGREAEGVINDVRGAINTVTDPLYKAAEAHTLTPAEMARVRALPGYPEAAAAVRGDPQLNRYVSHLPENSVGFLNEVKKYLDQARQNAAAPMAQNPNMQRAAGYGQDTTAVRQAAVNASRRQGGQYEAALAGQEHLRQQYLEPLLQGPLGKLAEKDIPTQRAIDALFPKSPLPNSQQEIATAVAGLARRNPRAAQDLVAAHVESAFNQATKDLQSGANQAGGAKFRAVLVGNPQQAANLEAAIRALPYGAARWEGFNRFLEILEATGTRQNKGSLTAYNTEFLTQAGKSGIPGEAVKAASNPFRAFQFLADKYETWKLGKNLNELVNILTDPRAVRELSILTKAPSNSGTAASAASRLIAITTSRAQPEVRYLQSPSKAAAEDD